jgi:hypothetical protein
MKWFTVTEAARYFSKDPSVIRRWCYSGAFLEFGFRAQRDPTGHWYLGVPDTIGPCPTGESCKPPLTLQHS